MKPRYTYSSAGSLDICAVRYFVNFALTLPEPLFTASNCPLYCCSADTYRPSSHLLITLDLRYLDAQSARLKLSGTPLLAEKRTINNM